VAVEECDGSLEISMWAALSLSHEFTIHSKSDLPPAFSH
jgi:hypothetical protein